MQKIEGLELIESGGWEPRAQIVEGNRIAFCEEVLGLNSPSFAEETVEPDVGGYRSAIGIPLLERVSPNFPF